MNRYNYCRGCCKLVLLQLSYPNRCTKCDWTFIEGASPEYVIEAMKSSAIDFYFTNYYKNALRFLRERGIPPVADGIALSLHKRMLYDMVTYEYIIDKNVKLTALSPFGETLCNELFGPAEEFSEINNPW
ncbi:MAG TPA: hypothetical protein ENI23_10610 [bacterium]|nr:hypothetical protein [bacterium]